MKTSLISLLSLTFFMLGFCTPSCAQDWNGLTGFATFNDLGRCGVTGGGAGEVVHVKSRAEFTNYAMSSKPYVIIVDNDIEGGGVNDLQDELHVASNKTIIGAGTGVMFNGINLMAKKAHNIILRNIKLRKGRIDGVSFQNCQHIWIDHCDFLYWLIVRYWCADCITIVTLKVKFVFLIVTEDFSIDYQDVLLFANIVFHISVVY